MRQRLRSVVVLAVALPCLVVTACGAEGDVNPVTAADVRWATVEGGAVVNIQASPFRLVVTDGAGRVLLESTDGARVGGKDPAGAYAALGVTHNTDMSVMPVGYGWDYYRGEDAPWRRATRATRIDDAGDGRLTVHLATDDPLHPAATLTLESQGIGLRLKVLPESPGTDDAGVNRVSLAFTMHQDDHFFGFGERFVRADHRGQLLYTRVEEGGFGHGEDVPPGPSNPNPSGEGMTNLPIPWFMSPRGFGVLVNTTYRVNFHLGDELPDAWRVEATTAALDMTVFVHPDPLRLLGALTEVTGRPPEVADWVLAPRRRANPGSDEVAKLRAAHIPTSVIDESVHYFPNGTPNELQGAAMAALTTDLHRRGFKAVAYFNPFVFVTWQPVYDEAVSKGYLVKKSDGSTYVVHAPYPAGAAMVDFTNPAAVAWYQAHLRRALADGWDGWMYDFGEYVPEDARLFNGMTGFEAHNLYPVLYQRAAFELLEREKKRDYLLFVRSGYAGTAGLTPMVWAGDQNADFDLADGLPAALTGALNAGMSGIPLWGSDIAGYHYLYNPPPDKDVYLRWTELGAFSADMHDENEGAGIGRAADRWQIWKDQESQDVYRKYASYKTRMLPYVRIAVRQARDRGTPVMRHLYLTHPGDARVYGITDEYMYGDALLVAPVVTRGARSRKVYLPDPAYFDFWTGARIAGDGEINADAPLGVVPVYAKIGAIVPMLARDVETVVPSSDPSVVSMQDRADFLEVAVFAGGSSTITLDDGTVLAQVAPATPFVPASPMRGAVPIPMVVTEAELGTCDACAWTNNAKSALSIAVVTRDETITAGALRLSVKGSPQVKRYLFSVRF